MRARLFTLVFVVLVAVGVAVAVVVVPGGEEEADGGEEQPAPAVVGAEAPAVAAPPEPVTLRYDRQDISGGATAPGSYAFLKTAGDATSAVDNFGNRSAWGVELRIHPTDATGASRAAFFDTVQVGDSFDYQTNRLACGYRFKVTRVAATATPRVFGVEYSTRYGGRCSTTVDDPTAARAVRFVWGVRPGIDGPGGVREMLYGAPTGPGTYRLDIGSPYVFDVPPGMKIIHDGLWLLEPSADAPSGAPSSVISLIDAATGSVLTIDPDTGRAIRRVIKSPEVVALFDQIIASIRRVDGAEAGGARAPVTTPPEPVTFRYDRLDISGSATAPGSYAFLKTAGEAASAIENFGYSADEGVELRIHPTDASGISRSAFYNTVQVGDVFDYRTNGLDCGFRFKVMSVGTRTSPRTFGLEHITSFGGRCDFVDDPAAAKDVRFVWGVRPGIPGPGGVRVLLGGEPTGEGTYRVHAGVSYVIDVPAGMQVILYGIAILGNEADAPPDAPRFVLMLLDAETGSRLGIDPETGREIGRGATSPEVAAFFDQIMASIRRG